RPTAGAPARAPPPTSGCARTRGGRRHRAGRCPRWRRPTTAASPARRYVSSVDARAAIEQLRTPEGWLTASASGERFGSLFGRDALVSALQLLPLDSSIAHATLERLGRELGTRADPDTEEEPGKVLHEARDHDLDEYVVHGWPVRDGRLRYYGSIDSGPWFLIVLGALARAGEDVAAHLEAARRVAGWLVARDMRSAFMHSFVGTRDAPPAFARHGESQKLDRSVTSDLGHVLWTGILDDLPIVRRATHTRLRAPDVRTPFGLRTLAASHAGFRPDGYHTGAVWPFDTWLGAGGLDAVEPGSGEELRAGTVDAVK